MRAPSDVMPSALRTQGSYLSLISQLRWLRTVTKHSLQGVKLFRGTLEYWPAVRKLFVADTFRRAGVRGVVAAIVVGHKNERVGDAVSEFFSALGNFRECSYYPGLQNWISIFF